MIPSRFPVTILCTTLVIAGCRRDRDRDARTASVPSPVSSQDQSLAPRELDRLVERVTRAVTPAEEFAALQRFREYLVDHKLTYRTRVLRMTDGRVIDRGASTATGPLRVTVETSQGRQVLRTFWFIPKDNRNLTLLGQ